MSDRNDGEEQMPLPWGEPIPVTRNTDQMRDYLLQQKQGRDHALALLEECRERLIAAGKSVARKIASEQGTVTASEVLATMRADPSYADDVAKFDPRWTGCLFRGGDWEHIDDARLGSHKRTVWVWRLKDYLHG